MLTHCLQLSEGILYCFMVLDKLQVSLLNFLSEISSLIICFSSQSQGITKPSLQKGLRMHVFSFTFSQLCTLTSNVFLSLPKIISPFLQLKAISPLLFLPLSHSSSYDCQTYNYFVADSILPKFLSKSESWRQCAPYIFQVSFLALSL